DVVGDGVGGSGVLLMTDGLYVVSKLCQFGRCRGERKTGSEEYDSVPAFVGGIDQLQIETVAIPLFCQGSAGYMSVEGHD
ncbi:MAG: hypothetical protein QF768_02835, partial [Candidatus Latescibacteria bacterium]|nr:hypothetical protein [Candidatus Latescibacterota bacterium]